MRLTKTILISYGLVIATFSNPTWAKDISKEPDVICYALANNSLKQLNGADKAGYKTDPQMYVKITKYVYTLREHILNKYVKKLGVSVDSLQSAADRAEDIEYAKFLASLEKYAPPLSEMGTYPPQFFVKRMGAMKCDRYM